jgi:hypothetical protein
MVCNLLKVVLFFNETHSSYSSAIAYAFDINKTFESYEESFIVQALGFLYFGIFHVFFPCRISFKMYVVEL